MTTPSSLKRILVGIDDSPGAARALTWAAHLAATTGATLLALHVLTYDEQFRRDLTLDTTTTWRRRVDAALQHEWTEPGRTAGVSIDCQLLEAESVAQGILDSARRGVDLIVLGAHGRGDLADRLLGATTYRVSHSASTPVVIIPVDWRPAIV